MLSAGFLSFILSPLELFLKVLMVFGLGICLALFGFLMAIWPVVIVSSFGFLPSPLIFFTVVSTSTLWVGLAFFLLIWYTRSFVQREFEIIKKVGPKHALWVDDSSWMTWSGTLSVRWTVAAFEVEDARLMGQFQARWLEALVGPGDFKNYYELCSVAWSSFIVHLHETYLPGPRVSLMFSIWSFNLLVAVYLKPLKKFWTLLRFYLVAAFTIFSLQPGATLFLVGFLFRISQFILSMFSRDFVEWVNWTFTVLVVELLNIVVEYHFVSRKWFNRSGFYPNSGKGSVVGVFTDTISKLAVVVSDIGLPHYIMGGKTTFDREHIQESLEIMKDAGWPINVSLCEPSRFGSGQAYADWIVSGTDWQQGIHNRKVYLDTALDPLRVKAVEWRRTEEYRTSENELKSVARYLKSPRYDYPDLELDDVWFLVGDIFRHSRITPFNYIIKMWEKKYALGSFMVDPQNPRKKHSRWKFISTIGYANFKKLWRRTFEIAPLLAPVAHVSVKDEALPPRKYLSDKVRTVIGSPLGQYIMSTVWNYSPNHNFKWRETPIKVGMPLNGYWMDHVFTAHSRCQIHYAGDMSEFDSTLSGKVQDLIKAVRKKGFEHHTDRERIARLIDINYEQVSRQLLNTTSSGDIYKKGTGLTTGHSSTSMDNSVGLVTLYLLAWKEITGLSAKEFKFYNELSCFGDDHLLSMAGNKPAAWNFRSIQAVMAKWGVTNNLEASGPLEMLSFLSKKVRSPTPADLADFKLAGVPRPRWAVYHERDKLVGKMVAKVKSMAPEYRLKRLISYLSLTAHHKDVYDMVTSIIFRTNTFRKYLKGPQNPKGMVVPSYQKVIQDWYKEDATFPENMIDEVTEQYHVDDSLLTYGSLTPIDSLLGALAVIPDFVNPAIFNMGYMTTLQSKLHRTVSWPVQLVALSNSAFGPAELTYMMRKTVYEFLDPSICVYVEQDANITTLLIRHWIFLWFKTLGAKAPSVFPLAAVVRQMANLQFTINGKLQLESRRFSFQIHDLFVVSLLSFIHVPDVLKPVGAINLPDINLLSEQVLFALQNLFWKSLPPNYSDVTPHLRKLDGEKTLVVSAPTGSGKSTALVKHTGIVVGHVYSKIIIVEPRSSIVKTIVPYVKNALQLDASGATSGMTLDQKSKFWYVTAQELLLHPSWYQSTSNTNLFILDECHVNEPAYELIKSELVRYKNHRMFVSATPDFSTLDPNSIVDVPLVSARLYNVHTSNVIRDDVMSKNDFVRHYVSDVLASIHTRPRSSVVLVFCTTLSMCYQLSEQCPRNNFVLSSGIIAIPQITPGTVIFSTSVADVGITLPNVDMVITSDIGFTVTHTLDESHEAYFRLSDNDLTQRCGRTGRTNNGSAVIVRCPKARFLKDISALSRDSTVFDLITAGIPLDTIVATHKSAVKSLLGLDDIPEARANATMDYALEQLSLYRSNLEPLLNERAKLLEIGTNDGSRSRPIDNARMGILMDSTSIPTQTFINSIVKVVRNLGLRSTANAEERAQLEEEVRVASLPLIGNIKSRLPYPDPDLGEWGMKPDEVSSYFDYVRNR
uniref:RdRp n=1 Tax=Erysiphe necator associated fusarivirus 1 TaxID=2695354 RepID=A0A7U3RD08_9VIRU|nr:RdRp [Erysiphe necator associated fusarivirus 1]